MNVADWQLKARADYVASFPKKLETIEALAAEWLDAPGDESRYESLRTAVHRIHGTAGSYGFHALGDIVAAWDDAMTAALKERSFSSGGTIVAVRQYLQEFRTEISGCIARETGG
jgi:hypothetical protein